MELFSPAHIESELKKRLVCPYKWGTRQNNVLDRMTNYIYVIPTFDELLCKISDVDMDIKNYAMNRWFNYVSAKAVEAIFAQHPEVTPYHNSRDKMVDFSLCGVNFDHKTSVFPKSFGHDIHYAVANKEELIWWLYKNQSQESRKHLKNRLFVVLYDPIKGEHWKLKAQISLIKRYVDEYVAAFNKDHLYSLDMGTHTALSDVIFVYGVQDDDVTD